MFVLIEWQHSIIWLSNKVSCNISPAITWHYSVLHWLLRHSMKSWSRSWWLEEKVLFTPLLNCVCTLQSYVNCALGIHQIGYVIVAYGAVSALASLAVGYMTASAHVRRVYVVVSGATFNAGLLLVLAWWTPADDDRMMFYIVSGCLGLCDAIWITQTNSQCCRRCRK